MSNNLQIKWHNEISERINMHNITNFTIHGITSLSSPTSYLSCEKIAEKELKQSIGCKDKKVFKAVNKYRTILKEGYFEIGVIIGICMATEILLKEDDV